MAQVRISNHADKKLNELAKIRKDNHSLVSNKGSIVEELVLAAYKKEYKNWEL